MIFVLISSRRYYDYIRETFLIYDIERCGKLNERIYSPRKVYVSDIGIKNHVVGISDIGSVFKNKGIITMLYI
jgi:predicted AAA+ superfamily ATPase